MRVSYKITIVLSLLLGLASCGNSSSGRKEAVMQKAISGNSLKTPDPGTFKKVANFVNPHERDSIINIETRLKNGKKRARGIKPVPQNGDDFRRAMLDNVYWNGVHVEEGDFRGASMR